jgi:hypothetical protein
MVTIEQVIYVIPILGLTASIFYYAIVIRNQNKTRQAQLFMDIYETYRSPEFRRQWTLILQQEWTDIDDFMEKYGLDTNPEAWSDWMSVASFFHGIGILVKKGLLQPSLLDEFIAPNVFMAWILMGPIVKGFKEYVMNPSYRSRYRDIEGQGYSKIFDAWSGFEYLYDELKRREQQQLELKS